MPAVSPNASLSELSIRLTITVNGNVVKDSIGITSVYVHHAVNKISYAEVVLASEIDVDSDTLAATDSDDFLPGAPVKITAGYGDQGETSIFEGIIVKQGIEIQTGTGYNLKLLCKHQSVKLTFNQKEEEFPAKTDSDMITSIFGKYGVPCTVDSTTTSNENFLQKLATDWDLVLSRAEFNGFLLLTDGDHITVGKPVFTADPVLLVALGDAIISFSAELDAENQPSSIEATAWDSKTLALLKSTATEPTLNAHGALKAKELPAKMGQAKLSMNAATALSVDELKTWADGRLLRMRLHALKGEVTFTGSALVKTGDLITLAGVGEKFNGDAFVTALSHSLSQGTWTTTVRFGLERQYLSQRNDFSYPMANGQLPGIQGLQTGIVKKLSADPQSGFRVQVTLASNAENAAGVWARMANFYATSAAGLAFLPEIGDEVVIGFLDNDPRFPVILGSLYGAKNTAPDPAADENNYIKSITTKGKLKITFDDENKVIRIESPGKNMLTISDKDKCIEIKDQNSNQIKLSADGISMSSPKDIVIDTKGNFKLSAASKITLASSAGDVEVSGTNITNTAKMGFTAKGNATAEVSASGQTTIKGGIVMIN